MSGAGHLFLRTLQPFTRTSLASASTSFSITPGITVKLLPSKLQLCHVMLRTSPLRTFKVQPKETPQWWQNFSTKIYKQLPVDTKMPDFLHWRNSLNSLRRSYRDSRPPANMHWLLGRAGWVWTVIPRWLRGSVVYSVVAYVSFYCGQWYNKHQVILPLNNRKAIHVMQNEDSLSRQREAFAQTLARADTNVITTRDENGVPTDALTLRCYNIMQTLIRANPELTMGLIDGITYNLHVVEGNGTFVYNGFSAVMTGDIVIPREHLDRMNDDEVAFTLGHEMTHVVQRHTMEVEGTNIFLFHLFNNFLWPIRDWTGFDMTQIMNVFKRSLNLTDPYVAEKEADDFGFKFAAAACYDYRQFPRALETMESVMLDWFNNHHRDQNNNPHPNANPPANGSGDGAHALVNAREVWENQILTEMINTGLNIYNRHLPTARRTRAMRSRAWLDKAVYCRRKAGCKPWSLHDDLPKK